MKDPVCGMEINEKHDSIEHKGKKYYFCCASFIFPIMWYFINQKKKVIL